MIAEDPIRVAIRDQLLGSTDLTDLLSEPEGIYYELAPSGTVLPYVIFNEMTDGSLLWTMAGPPVESVDWLIKGVGADYEVVDSIQREIRRVMDRAEFPIDDHNNLLCMRKRRVSYPEVTDGERYAHRGDVYKITTEEQS